MTAKTMTAPPCPHWCEFAGQEYDWDSEDGEGRLLRGHSNYSWELTSATDRPESNGRPRAVWMYVGATEVEGEPMPTPHILLETSRFGTGLSADEARRVAAKLLELAGKVDQIAAVR